MCLITKQKEPIILEEDLIVYKILNKVKLLNGNFIYSSPFNAFVWVLNKLYDTEIKLSDDFVPFDIIDEKMLAEISNTSNFCIDGKTSAILKDKGYVSYGEGFHSAKTIERFKSFGGDSIFECLIPKGSEVYYNENDLIVSNQIIILKEIENEKTN